MNIYYTLPISFVNHQVVAFPRTGPRTTMESAPAAGRRSGGDRSALSAGLPQFSDHAVQLPCATIVRLGAPTTHQIAPPLARSQTAFCPIVNDVLAVPISPLTAVT